MIAKQYWPKENLRGEVFGRLTVIEFAGWRQYKSGTRSSLWKCRCECDEKEVCVTAKELKSGHTSSCGCLQKETRQKVGLRSRQSTPDNPVAARNYAYESTKRGCKDRNLCWELTFDQWQAIVKQNCYYCNAEPSPYVPNHRASRYGLFLCNGIDRYWNNEGYVINNCVPCCWTCNRLKGGMDGDEFIDHINKISGNHRPKLSRNNEFR